MSSDECDCSKVRVCRSVWEGNAKFVKRLEMVQMTAADNYTRMLKYNE